MPTDEFDEAHVAPAIAIGEPLRQAVQGLADALTSSGEDPTRCAEEFRAALLPLVERHRELFALATPRPPSRINPEHRMSTVYFDPSMMLQVVGAPRGFRLPPHSHSAWNVLFVCEGSMQFTSYRRSDDRSIAGRADLEVADDRVLGPGDAGIVAPPPNDIHELEILSDYLWMIVVTPEPEVAVRQIHSISAGTYELQELAPIPPLLSSV